MPAGKALSEAVRDAIVFELEVEGRKQVEVAKTYGLSHQHVFGLKNLKWYKKRINRIREDGELVLTLDRKTRGKLFIGRPDLALNEIENDKIKLFMDIGLHEETIANSYGITRDDVYDIADGVIYEEGDAHPNICGT